MDMKRQKPNPQQVSRGLTPIGRNSREEFFRWMQAAREVVQRDFSPLPEGAAVEMELRLGLLITGMDATDSARAFPSIPGSHAVVVNNETRKQRGIRFVSGVSEHDYGKFVDSARKLCPVDKGGQVDTVRNTAYNYGNGQRINQAENGELTTESKKKVPVSPAAGSQQHVVDIAMPACPYDVRIGITIETPEAPGALAPNWEQKRFKDRHSFRPPNSSWQLDLTTVTTEKAPGLRDPGEGPQRTFEVSGGTGGGSPAGLASSPPLAPPRRWRWRCTLRACCSGWGPTPPRRSPARTGG
jgi:hypothetical protein